ncbi:LacI family DNA-binding transcriptional regulator [Neobacillus niacini]|uniref:LacI family DNA-binding transcriptional regulator n=1 Tax=Neobacillus niacini TaxID=86668 RepID=UPI002FFECD8C
MKMEKITITDIARLSNVSKTTVSRIINGNYGKVNKDTKERVLRIIEELNYQPNTLAQGLKLKTTNVIGIVLSKLHPFWSAVLEGVEDACRSQGYSLMISNTGDDPELEVEQIKSFMQRKVDGVIVSPTIHNKAFYEELIERSYPIVAVSRKTPNVSLNAVAMNDIKGSWMATEHLLSLGRKRIMLVVYPPNEISPRYERVAGFNMALSAQGNQESWVEIVDEKPGMAKQKIIEVLKEKKVDAIISTNNILNLEILKAVKESGLKIPEDVAIVGYDDPAWAELVDPPLTSVYQPAYEMGEKAAKRLIELIKNTDKTEPETTIFEPKLIIRKSCGEKGE